MSSLKKINISKKGKKNILILLLVFSGLLIGTVFLDYIGLWSIAGSFVESPVVNELESSTSASSIRLDWYLSDAEDYYVYRSIGDGDFVYIGHTKLAFYVDLNLESGLHSYYVKSVARFRRAGTSNIVSTYVGSVDDSDDSEDNSDPVYSIEDINPILLKPTLIVDTFNFLLSWESVEDAKSFHIYRSDNGDTLTEIGLVNGDTLSYIDMDLTEGNYLYRIIAKDIDFKESKFSNFQIVILTIESSESSELDLNDLILPIVILIGSISVVIVLGIFISKRKRISSNKRIK